MKYTEELKGILAAHKKTKAKVARARVSFKKAELNLSRALHESSEAVARISHYHMAHPKRK